MRPEDGVYEGRNGIDTKLCAVLQKLLLVAL